MIKFMFAGNNGRTLEPKQRQEQLWEFKANLFYIASFRIARSAQRPSQNKQNKTNLGLYFK